MNGSSSFYKGPRTCKVSKSADPAGPWTFAKTTTPIYISRQYLTSHLDPTQLWKLENKKLINKENIWSSTDNWKFVPPNSDIFYIENISKQSKKVVLERTQDDDGIVIEADFDESKEKQLWRKVTQELNNK